MRILQLTRSLDPAGGGPCEGIRLLSTALEPLGIHSTVACLDAAQAPWLASWPETPTALGPVRGTFGYRRGLSQELHQLAQQHDLVLIHGLWQYHGLACWRALRGTAIPYLVFPHGMLDPWFKHTYPLKHLKKWAYWPWADYRVLRDAEAVLFTTEAERLLARQSFWLYQAREQVVGLGTSPPPGNPEAQRQQFQQAFPQLGQQRLLLFLGRLHPKKGLDLLIEALAAVAPTDPRLHLLIAGPDQLGWQAALEQRVQQLGLGDRVTWAGMLQGDLKWGALHTAELFCLPSHQENYGIAVAEALACSLPVAIAHPVNLSTNVQAAGAGLVHADTVAGTTEALRTWLQLPAAAKQAMAAQALELFNRELHIQACAQKMQPILEQAVARRQGTGQP